jgi:hypothetical protein
MNVNVKPVISMKEYTTSKFGSSLTKNDTANPPVIAANIEIVPTINGHAKFHCGVC